MPKCLRSALTRHVPFYLLALLAFPHLFGANGAQAQRTRVGIALGGGAIPGIAHIGVLQWLYANQIPLDAITGTSTGALIGGIYAIGQSPAELESTVRAINLRELFATRNSYSAINVRRREDREELPTSIQFGLRHGLSLDRSLSRPEALEAALDRVLLPYGDTTSFDKLPIPFRCVATDLAAAEAVALSHGSLARSVRASAAIPGVFPPVTIDGRELVDGGLLENIPVDITRAMHVDRVIAVQVAPPTPTKSSGSLLDTLQRTVSATVTANERRSLAHADVIIRLETQSINLDDADPVGELVRAGWAAAEKQRDALLPLRVSDQDWRDYLERVSGLRRPPTVTPTFVTARGGNAAVQAAAVKAIQPSLDRPVNPVLLEKELDEIRGSERWGATYTSEIQGNQSGLLVHLGDSAAGPPFLLVGGEVLAQSSDISRINFDQRFIWQDAGGYGSEFRLTSRFGFETDLAGEYYYKLGLSRFFWAPRAMLDRDPVYLYQNQVRTAALIDRQAGGGFDVGVAIDNKSELRAGWEAQTITWIPQIENNGPDRISGPVHRFVARYSYLGQDHATVARKGFLLRAEAGYLLPGPLERGTPIGTVHAAKFFPLGDKNVIAMAVTGATYFGRAVADPLRFTLGGPYDLGSAAIGEYRADDVLLVQPAFLHQIATLPSVLGDRLYIAAAYEAGRVGNIGEPAILRQDGILGLVGETPLGPIGFGFSLGDAGHHKVFVSIGRAFGQ